MLFVVRPKSETIGCFPLADMGAISGVPLSKRLLASLFVLGGGLIAAFLFGKADSEVPCSTQTPENITITGRLSTRDLDYAPDEIRPAEFFDNGPRELYCADNLPLGCADNKIVQRVYRPVADPLPPFIPSENSTDVDMDKKFPETQSSSTFDKLPTRPCVRYKTNHGDTLRSLALRFLKSEDRWQDIYEFNKEQLTSKDTVPVGIILFIPIDK